MGFENEWVRVFVNAKSNEAQQCEPQDISPGRNTIVAAYLVAPIRADSLKNAFIILFLLLVKMQRQLRQLSRQLNKSLMGLKQKLSPNVAQTRYISGKYVTSMG